jgi:sugar lactone lactonase YvrE
MRKDWIITIASALLFAVVALPAIASDRQHAELFAVLPSGSSGPEGLTVGPDGNVYVTTFGFNAQGEVAGPSRLLVFRPDGQLIRNVAISGASPHTLGLGFNPLTGDLIVLDFGAGTALKVNPVTGASSIFMTVTGSSGLNALTFDKAGNLYVSDSFQGIVWRTGPSGGAGTVWVQDSLLTPNGVPPFGANGIEFNNERTAMLVANTANDQIITIPVANGQSSNPTAGQPAVLVNSINGADGIVIDANDNIWVAANQEDEIVVINPTGKVIGKLGEFYGIGNNGTPQGLLFPASPAFSLDRRTLYVSNLALDLRLAVPASVAAAFQTTDSQWTDQVHDYTISKINTNFNPIGSGQQR